MFHDARDQASNDYSRDGDEEGLTSSEEQVFSPLTNAINKAKQILIQEEDTSRDLNWEELRKEIVIEIENQLSIYCQLKESNQARDLRSIMSQIIEQLKNISFLLSSIKDRDFQEQSFSASSQSLRSSPQKGSPLQSSPRSRLHFSSNDIRRRSKSTSYATSQLSSDSLSQSLTDLQMTIESFAGSRLTQSSAHASSPSLRVMALSPRHPKHTASTNSSDKIPKLNSAVAEHLVELTLAYHSLLNTLILQGNILWTKISEMTQSKPSTPTTTPRTTTPRYTPRKDQQHRLLESNLDTSIRLLSSRLGVFKRYAPKGTLLLAAFQNNQSMLQTLQNMIEQQSQKNDFMSQMYQGFLKLLDKHVLLAVAQKIDDLKAAEIEALKKFNDICEPTSNNWQEVEFQDKQRNFIRTKTEMGLQQVCRDLNIDREHLFLRRGKVNIGGTLYEHVRKNAPMTLGPFEVDEALEKLESAIEDLSDGQILSNSCYGLDGFKVMNLEYFSIDALVQSILAREYNEDLTQFLGWFFSIYLQSLQSDNSNLTFILSPSSSKTDFSNHFANEFYRKLGFLGETEKQEIYSYFMNTLYPRQQQLVLAHHLQNIHGRLQYLVNSGTNFPTSDAQFDNLAMISLAEGYSTATRTVKESMSTLIEFVDTDQIEIDSALLLTLRQTKSVLDAEIQIENEDFVKTEIATLSSRSSFSKHSAREL